MKKINTLLLSTLTSLVILFSGAMNVFADASFDPYQPYGPHKPVPTGFGDIDTFVLVGILSYIGGLSLIVGSQYLKSKVVK